MRILGLSFMVALSGAMAPGPLLALVISQVLAQGFPAVLFVMLGHALLEIGFIVILRCGLGRLLARPRTRALLGSVGAVVLCWMGVMLLRQAGEASLATARDAAQTWYSLVLAGIGVSLSNPYFTGWWATVGTGQMAALGLKSRRDYLLFYAGHEGGDIGWYCLVAGMLAFGKNWLTDPLYRGLLYGCGGAILALAATFLVLSLRLLRRPPAIAPA